MINPLENLDPETRIRLIVARIRNVCYYKSIDDRPRAQYMHVFRSLRADISFVLKSLPDELKMKWGNMFVDILRIIPPKIKTHDCSQVASNLMSYIDPIINWNSVNYVK